MRFSIGSKITVKAGKLSKKSLAGIVTDATHIETIWDLLKNKNIINEDPPEESSIGRFITNQVFGTNADNAIKTALDLSEGSAIKYTETALVKLIKKAAAQREISFSVDGLNTETVDFLETGLSVQTMYDYSKNYSCSPNKLTGIKIDTWQHNRSFLFHATSVSDMKMQDFTTSKNYTVSNSIGQWEANAPGLAISFDRALEVESGQGKIGLLTTSDTSKLVKLQPTLQGLTMEAWINPQKISTEQDQSRIIFYKNREHGYSLGIKKAEDKYECFAIIEDNKVNVNKACGFSCWKHLAVTYKKYWGLKLKGTSVNCGNDMSLSLDGEFAIELLVKFDNDSDGILLCKGGEYCIK